MGINSVHNVLDLSAGRFGEVVFGGNEWLFCECETGSRLYTFSDCDRRVYG